MTPTPCDTSTHANTHIACTAHQTARRVAMQLGYKRQLCYICAAVSLTQNLSVQPRTGGSHHISKMPAKCKGTTMNTYRRHTCHFSMAPLISSRFRCGQCPCGGQCGGVCPSCLCLCPAHRRSPRSSQHLQAQCSRTATLVGQPTDELLEVQPIATKQAT